MERPVSQPLTVPGTLESLTAIGAFVLAAANAAGLGKKQAYSLRLAVDEIATNVITHGYGEAGLIGDITLHARVDEDSLTILLEDSAAEFDPRHSHTEGEDALDQPLEERPVGGLGVYLAERSVDRLTYERVGDRNRTTFVVTREPQHT